MTTRQIILKYGDATVDTHRYEGALEVARRVWRGRWDDMSLREKVTVVREQFLAYYGLGI